MDIQTQDATDAITSIVKAFGVNVDDIESIMDKLVVTGNNFPVSVEQLSTGLTNASSALAAAGNTFEESVALLTAANTTIQDASKSSTGLRTIAARLRNTKTELEDLGEETLTYASYQNIISALTKQGVALTDMNGEFRSTYDILHDIAMIWDDLSTMEQAGLATTISGTRQQAVFYSIIEQFREAEGAMDAMSSSAGLLQKSYDTYMKSTTAHINQFKTAMQSLGSNIFDSGFLNSFVDAGTGVVNILDKIVSAINKLGGATTVIWALTTAIGALAASNLTTRLSKLGEVLTNTANMWKSAYSALASEGDTTFTRMANAARATGTTIYNSLGKVGTVFLGVSTALGVLYAAYKKYQAYQKEIREESQRNAAAAVEEMDSLSELAAKYEELASKEEIDDSTREDIKDVQQEIVSLVGHQAEGLDLVNGKLDVQLAKLKEITQENMRENIPKLETYDDVVTSEYEDAGNATDFKTHGVTMDEIRTTLGRMLNNGLYEEQISSILDRLVNSDFVDTFKYAKYNAEDLLALLEDVQSIVLTPEFAEESRGWLNNPFVDLNGMKTTLDEQITFLQELKANKEDIDKEYGEALAEADFNDYLKEHKINSQDAYDYMMKQLEMGTKPSDDAGLEYLDEYKQKYIDLAREAFPQYIDKLNWADAVTGEYKSAVVDTTKAMQDLDSAISAMDKAQEDMLTYGSLTTETLAALEKENANYIEYLYEENGQVKLNTDAWLEYSKTKVDAKTNELQDESAYYTKSNVGIESQLKDYWDLTEQYKEANNELDKARRALQESTGEFANQSVFGNIDLFDPSQTIVWTDSLKQAFKSVIESWGYEIENLKANMRLSDTMDMSGLHITVSPQLITEDGIVVLTPEEMGQYLTEIIKEARETVPEGMEIPLDVIYELDAKGVTINEKQIRNVVANVTKSKSQSVKVQAAIEMDDTNEVKRAQQKVKDLEQEMERMRNELGLSEEAISGLTQKFNEQSNTVEENAEKIRLYELALDKLEKQREFSYLDDIAQADDAIQKLGKAIGDFQQNGALRAADFDGLTEIFGYFDSYDELVGLLTDSSSTMADVQAAANRLGAEFLNEVPILDNLTASNAGVVQSLLESIGVTNADVLVKQQLAIQDAETALQEAGLANAVWTTQEQFLREQGAANNVIAALKRAAAQHTQARLAALDYASATSAATTAILQETAALGMKHTVENQRSYTWQMNNLVERAEKHELTDVEENEFGDMFDHLKALADKEIQDFLNSLDVSSVVAPEIIVPPVTSGSGSGNKGNKGNGNSAKKATEEYIADIDKFAKAIERLERVQFDKERFELHFENDDLVGQIESMDKYIELEKEEQNALAALAAERKAYISEKVTELRGIGFNVEWDPQNNRLVINNLEHINELQAKSIGQYDDMQEATNEYRKKYEKLIDEVLDYNKEDQENSQQWWEDYYAIIEHELERFDKQIELIQGKIDKLTTRSESRAKRADFTSTDPKAKADAQEVLDMYKQIDEALAKEQDLLVKRAQARREQGFTDDDPQIIEDSNKWWDLQEERIENMTTMYENALTQYDNRVAKNNLFMDNLIKKGASEVAGGFSKDWLSEMQKYQQENEDALLKQQDLIHQLAEYYRSQGFDEDSTEIQELRDRWWAKQDEILENRKKTFDSMVDQFENAIESEEYEMDKLGELGSTMGENGLANGFVSQMAEARDRTRETMELEQDIIEEFIEFLKADQYHDNSELIAELTAKWREKEEEKLQKVEESYETIFSQYENGLKYVQHDLDELLEKAASTLRGGMSSTYVSQVFDNVDQALQYIHDQEYYIQEYIDYLKSEENYKDNSDKIMELMEKYWDYERERIEIITSTYEKIVNQFDNAIADTQRILEMYLKRSGSNLMDGITGSSFTELGPLRDEILDYIEQAQQALEDEMGYLLAEGYSEFSEEYAALTDKWYEYEQQKIDLIEQTYTNIVQEYENGIEHLNRAIEQLIPALHVGIGEEFSRAQLDKIDEYTAKIVDYYEKMKEQAYALIEYYRGLGYSDDSPEISEQINALYDYEAAIRQAWVTKFEALISHFDNELSYSAMMLTQTLDKATTDLHDTYSGQWYNDAKKYLDEVVAYNRSLQDQQMQLIEYYRSLGYSDSSDEISELVTSWWEEENEIRERVIEAYQSVLDQYQNSIDREQKTLEGFFEKSGSKELTALDVDSLDAAREQAWQLESYYRTMQDVVTTMADYYRSLGYEENSDEISQLTEQWMQYEEAIEDVKQSVIDNLNAIVDNTSRGLDEISGAYDTFKNAANEFAENGGFLSVDTFQAILELGPQYMQYLNDENGLLVINEAKIQDMIKAKIEQLALDNALTYVERLRMAIMEGSIEDLNNLIFATTATTDATWGLVYANLAMLDLTPEQYEQALHNIDAMRDLANAAAAGVGKVAGEASDNIEEWSSALDDLIKYVIAMLQQRLDDYIESLEDLKEAYEDIIEAKEKELDLTRDEADYADEVADKAKELAKLQAKYEALGLDDSRDAQAQKAKLAEQMADLQDELNKTQRDHSIDFQKESLDKQEEQYLEAKDKEIEEAEKYFSSYQKQYDAAVAYIKEHWSTLLSELMEWNYEYGDVLNQEIVDAWNSCLEAMQNYGWTVDELLTNMKSKLEELKQAQEELNNTVVAGTQNYNEYHQAQQQAIQDQTPQPNDVPDFNPGPSNTPPSHNDGNYVEPEDPYPWRDPDKDYGSHDVPKPSPTPQERPTYPDPEPFYPETESKPEPEPEPDEPERPLAMLEIVKKMAANSEKWRQDSDPVNRAVLEARNRKLEEQLHPFGVYSELNTGDGWWYITSDAMNPEFVGRKLYDCYYGVYHTGGIAGIGPLKNDEVLAKLQKGEVIISNQDKGSLYGLIDFVSKLNNAMDAKFTSNAVDLMSNVNSMMDNSRNEKITPNGPVITFGDMYITGTNEETVKAHKEINRKFTNEILKYLDLKR